MGRQLITGFPYYSNLDFGCRTQREGFGSRFRALEYSKAPELTSCF